MNILDAFRLAVQVEIAAKAADAELQGTPIGTVVDVPLPGAEELSLYVIRLKNGRRIRLVGLQARREK